MEKTESSKILFLLKDITDLNTEFAVGEIGGSESMYEILLKKVIGLIPSNIEAMDKFLDVDNDIGAFAIRVHGVKGSLRQVGCESLAKLAEELEKAAKANDKQRCVANYGAFKEELLKFYEQVNSILRGAEDTAENSGSAQGNINEYIDALKQVKAAAAGFDTILAVSYLAPLLKLRFGGEIDALLKNAANEFDAYRPRKALAYITKLLDEYPKLSQQRGEEKV